MSLPLDDWIILQRKNKISKMSQTSTRRKVEIVGELSVCSMDWLPSKLDASSLLCNIDRWQACKTEAQTDCLTPTMFAQRYVGNQPVIISGLTDAWPAMTRWTQKDVFLKHYGDLVVQYGTGQDVSLIQNVPSTLKLAELMPLMALDPDLFVFNSGNPLFLQKNHDDVCLLDDLIMPVDWVGLTNMTPSKGFVVEQPDENEFGHYHLLSYGCAFRS
jgi:hypothetical protein